MLAVCGARISIKSRICFLLADILKKNICMLTFMLLIQVPVKLHSDTSESQDSFKAEDINTNFEVLSINLRISRNFLKLYKIWMRILENL